MLIVGNFRVVCAGEEHLGYANEIVEEMQASAQVRGTGIAKRTPEYLQQKMQEGKAIIALDAENKWAGFCYIETWQSGEYVANSGLIISPPFRNRGLAKLIKEQIRDLSRKKYPNAKIFGLTTGLAVMKINSELGYKPVTYSELTTDKQFWNGCKSCVNYSILTSKDFKNCLCTAMICNIEPGKNKELQSKNPAADSKFTTFLKRLAKLKAHMKIQIIENQKWT